jgi:hypothetical protein
MLDCLRCQHTYCLQVKGTVVQPAPSACSGCAGSRLFKITWTLKEGGWLRYIATQLAGMYRQVFGVGKVSTLPGTISISSAAVAAATSTCWTACTDNGPEVQNAHPQHIAPSLVV